MLETLKVPYLLRTLAVSLDVTQTVRCAADSFEICNETAIGKTRMVHELNAGDRKVVDSKGETVLSNATFREDREFPVVIKAVLPQGKGFTRDARRIVGDVMEQVLEYWPPGTNKKPVVMRRFWIRLLGEGNEVVIGKTEKEGNKVVVGNGEIGGNKIATGYEEELKFVKTERVKLAKNQLQQSIALDENAEDVLQRDWATMALAAGFFTSAWMRGGVLGWLEVLLWLGVLVGLRHNELFPVGGAAVKTLFRPAQEFSWWAVPVASWSATMCVIIAFTMSCFSEKLDSTAMFESLLFVAAYFWTRRASFSGLSGSCVSTLDLDSISQVLKDSATKLNPWLEALVYLAIMTIILTSGDEDYVTCAFSIVLYAVARYRVFVLSGESMEDLFQFPSMFSFGESVSTAVVTRTTSPPHPQPSIPSVHITGSRLVSYGNRPYAQYSAEVDLGDNNTPKYTVWVRYRDLLACHDQVEAFVGSKKVSSLMVTFPKKGWSRSNADEDTTAERVKGLGVYFSTLFETFPKEASSFFELDTFRHTFDVDSRSVLFRETTSCLRALSRAKVECEDAANVGEAEGWSLIKPKDRLYSKTNENGGIAFKRLLIVNTPPLQVLEKILRQRCTWDDDFVGEVKLRTIRQDSKDMRKAFGGYSLFPVNEYYIKRVVRGPSSVFSMRLRHAVVAEASCKDERTGRLVYVETSLPAGSLFGSTEADATCKFDLDSVHINGFVLDPVSEGRTLVTMIRSEEYCTRPFSMVGFS